MTPPKNGCRHILDICKNKKQTQILSVILQILANDNQLIYLFCRNCDPENKKTPELEITPSVGKKFYSGVLMFQP